MRSRNEVDKIYDEMVNVKFPFRELLRRFDLTQNEFAAIVNMSQPGVSKWCRIEKIEKIREKYNLYLSLMILFSMDADAECEVKYNEK